MSNSDSYTSKMSELGAACSNSKPIEEQPIDYSTKSNSTNNNQNENIRSNANIKYNIFVPLNVNKKTNIDALSEDFQKKMQEVIAQQEATAPVLGELREALKKIADKYDYDEAGSSDSAISSLLNSPPHLSQALGNISLKNKQQCQQIFPNNNMPQITANNESTEELNVAEEDDDEEKEVVEEIYLPQKQARMEYDPQYPKLMMIGNNAMVMVGPNGTLIKFTEYDAMQWNSAAIATRCLLNIIFTANELATHTLSGKPSPAFHGRERPTKIQLDPLKVADIIHCIVVKTGGKERDVRATITTKCADSAKLHKKRSERKSIN